MTISPVFYHGELNSVLFKVWGFYWLKNDEIFFKNYLPENHNQKNSQLPDLSYTTISSNLTDSVLAAFRQEGLLGSRQGMHKTLDTQHTHSPFLSAQLNLWSYS